MVVVVVVVVVMVVAVVGTVIAFLLPCSWPIPSYCRCCRCCCCCCCCYCYCFSPLPLPLPLLLLPGDAAQAAVFDRATAAEDLEAKRGGERPDHRHDAVDVVAAVQHRLGADLTDAIARPHPSARRRTILGDGVNCGVLCEAADHGVLRWGRVQVEPHLFRCRGPSQGEADAACAVH